MPLRPPHDWSTFRFARLAHNLLIVIAATCLGSSTASARPPADLEKFERGNAAMGAGRCDRAVEIFESVTPQRKFSARWIELAAAANACSGKLATAIEYYRKLDARLGTDPVRSRRIADLEARSRRQEEDPQQRRRPSLDGEAEHASPASASRAAESAIPETPISGLWREADEKLVMGRNGEGYSRRLRLDVTRGRAVLRGQVFVEPELRDEKFRDGAVQWYEVEARGASSPRGVELEGTCSARVWSFDKARVVRGAIHSLRGSFLRTSNRDLLSFRSDTRAPLPCGVELGGLEPSHRIGR